MFNISANFTQRTYGMSWACDSNTYCFQQSSAIYSENYPKLYILLYILNFCRKARPMAGGAACFHYTKYILVVSWIVCLSVRLSVCPNKWKLTTIEIPFIFICAHIWVIIFCDYIAKRSTKFEYFKKAYSEKISPMIGMKYRWGSCFRLLK